MPFLVLMTPLHEMSSTTGVTVVNTGYATSSVMLMRWNSGQNQGVVAPSNGFEPLTFRLTGGRSTY